jgi:hypothetical protein
MVLAVLEPQTTPPLRAAAGTVTFDWNYSSNDSPGFDGFGYLLRRQASPSWLIVVVRAGHRRLTS